MRREAGLNLVELKIALGILVVLLIIAIPAYLGYARRVASERAAKACVGALAAGQKDPCATTHAQPPVTLQGGTLKQPLPPPTEAVDVPGDSLWIRVEKKGDVLHARVRNDGWFLWLAAPVSALFPLAAAFGLASEARHNQDRAAGIASAVFFVAALAIVMYLHRTVSYEIDVPQRRLSRRVTVWGLPFGSSTREGIVGVAATKLPHAFALTAYAKSGDPVDLAILPEASLGLASRLQAAFEGR